MIVPLKCQLLQMVVHDKLMSFYMSYICDHNSILYMDLYIKTVTHSE